MQFEGLELDLDISHELRSPLTRARLNAELLPDDLPQISADALRLRLAIRNPIDNAMRHGAGGTATPELALKQQASSLRLSVRDFGTGVDPTH